MGEVLRQKELKLGQEVKSKKIDGGSYREMVTWTLIKQVY